MLMFKEFLHHELSSVSIFLSSSHQALVLYAWLFGCELKFSGLSAARPPASSPASAPAPPHPVSMPLDSFGVALRSPGLETGKPFLTRA